MGIVGSIQQLPSNVVTWNLESQKLISVYSLSKCEYCIKSDDFIAFKHRLYFSLKRSIVLEDDLSLRLRSSKEVSLQLDMRVKLQYENESKDFSLTNLHLIGDSKELSKMKSEGLLRITCTFFRIQEVADKFVETAETNSRSEQTETCNTNDAEKSNSAKIEHHAVATGKTKDNDGQPEDSKNLNCGQVIASNSEIEESVKTRGLLALSGNLKDIFLDEEDSDIIFNVGDQKYPAHKIIIRARSPVFYAMLKHDMKEKREGSVNIKDCDPHIFKDFLLYLYTGKLDRISKVNVFELYHMSDKYDVNELKMDCIDFIFNNLSVEIVCDVLSLAMKHCERDLLKYATNFFIENAKDILLTVNWQTFVKENPIEANELFIKTLNNVSKN